MYYNESSFGKLNIVTNKHKGITRGRCSIKIQLDEVQSRKYCIIKLHSVSLIFTIF